MHVDNFATDYPGCTEIQGLTISGANITNLDGLSQIISINGNEGLSIGEADALTSLDGLSNVGTVNGEAFAIWRNDILNSFNGLSNVTSSSVSNFEITNNPLLFNCANQGICTILDNSGMVVAVSGNGSTCNGSQNFTDQCNDLPPPATCVPITLTTQEEVDNWPVDCTEINGLLGIMGTDITNLNGLSSLTQINGTLKIENTSIQNLQGLENLVIFSGGGGELDSFIIRSNTNLLTLGNLVALNDLTDIHFLIENNPSLTSLTGLDSLMWGYNIIIRNNASLTDLTGLNNLNQSLDFTIEDNSSLTSLEGLDNLGLVDYFTIKDNDLLGYCSVPFFCETYYYDTSISNNLGGCNSLPEILDNCNTYAIASGLINQCEQVQMTAISGTSDIDILDVNGNIVCTINPNGNDLGMTDVSLYISDVTRYNPAGFPYINRNIAINPTTQPTTSVDVTFYYTEEEFNVMQVLDPSIFTPLDLQIAKEDGSCQSMASVDYTVVSVANGGIYGGGNDVYVSFEVDSFSDFFGFSASSALPVTWTTGLRSNINDKNQVVLNWSSSTHINHDYFEVQHSIDNRTYTRIYKDENNYGLENQNHQYIHANPESGTNYYRIKQVDFDGSYDFSNITSANVDSHVLIFPNPFNDKLTIEGNGISEVTIYNMLGELVYSKKIEGDITDVDLSHLEQSMYILDLEGKTYRIFKH